MSLWRKDYESKILVEEWRRLCSVDPTGYHADPVDLKDEIEGFRAHRHDQSILSILAKVPGSTVLSSSEIPKTGSKEHLKPWRKS